MRAVGGVRVGGARATSAGPAARDDRARADFVVAFVFRLFKLCADASASLHSAAMSALLPGLRGAGAAEAIADVNVDAGARATGSARGGRLAQRGDAVFAAYHRHGAEVRLFLFTVTFCANPADN